MNFKKKLYTIHCQHCLTILGVSDKDFRDEDTLCLECATKEMLSQVESDSQKTSKKSEDKN